MCILYFIVFYYLPKINFVSIVVECGLKEKDKQQLSNSSTNYFQRKLSASQKPYEDNNNHNAQKVSTGVIETPSYTPSALDKQNSELPRSECNVSQKANISIAKPRRKICSLKRKSLSMRKIPKKATKLVKSISETVARCMGNILVCIL